MISELPQYVLYLLIGAFVAGWFAAKLGAILGRRLTGGQRDPREDRIRSLEAELRVARSSLARSEVTIEEKDEELASSKSTVDEYATTMNEQATEMERLGIDLRDSVRKTNELREELTDRAEANVRATVRLHDVETELSVAHAGSQMMETAKLEYNSEDDAADAQETGNPKVVKFTL